MVRAYGSIKEPSPGHKRARRLQPPSPHKARIHALEGCVAARPHAVGYRKELNVRKTRPEGYVRAPSCEPVPLFSSQARLRPPQPSSETFDERLHCERKQKLWKVLPSSSLSLLERRSEISRKVGKWFPSGFSPACQWSLLCANVYRPPRDRANANFLLVDLHRMTKWDSADDEREQASMADDL